VVACIGRSERRFVCFHTTCVVRLCVRVKTCLVSLIGDGVLELSERVPAESKQQNQERGHIISTKWTKLRSLPSRVSVEQPAFCVVYRPQVDGAVAGSGHDLTADQRGQ
jgi:hypothetical protein